MKVVWVLKIYLFLSGVGFSIKRFLTEIKKKSQKIAYMKIISLFKTKTKKLNT